jgi:hypothetical protein
MSYRLVLGTFQLAYQGERFVGSKPDGDSVWFKPRKRSRLQNISGRDAKFNGGGFAQLRFEGIDALEVHFPHSEHQKQAEAAGARNYLLHDLLGFDVHYKGEAMNGDAATDPFPRTVTETDPVNVDGFILTRAIDPYQRPVAFVFVGVQPPGNDGDEVFADVALINKSANAKIMNAGWAYPAFYTHRENEGGLPFDLRDRLTELANNAFPDRGLWPVDMSRENPRIRDLDDLQRLAIWPKLYRRLADYFGEGNVGLGGFDAWIRGKKTRDDQVWLVPRQELGNLHDTYEVSGDHLNMLYWPEEMMVVPR